MVKIEYMRFLGFDISRVKQSDGSYFYPFKGFFSQLVGMKGEEYIDVSKPYEAFNTIPQLRNVIEKKGNMHANACFKLVDKEGKEYVIDELYKLLENPNPLMGQNDFIKERVMQRSVYAKQFVYANRPTNVQDFPSAVWNISPRYMKAVLSGKVFDQTRIEDIITKYVYEDMNGKKEFKTSEIMYTANIDIDNPVSGASPVAAMAKPLSNIVSSYKFLNKSLTKMGAYGLLSDDSKAGGMGSVVMDPKRRDEFIKEYTEMYGADYNQHGILFTEASLKYTPMGYPVKQMMPFENLDHGLLIICDNYGIDARVLSNYDTKFADLFEAIKKTYTDTIIPEADAFAQQLSSFILPEKLKGKYFIKAYFDHIPILQTDFGTGVDALNKMIQALNSAVESKLIDAKIATTAIDNQLRALNLVQG